MGPCPYHAKRAERTTLMPKRILIVSYKFSPSHGMSLSLMFKYCVIWVRSTSERFACGIPMVCLSRNKHVIDTRLGRQRLWTTKLLQLPGQETASERGSRNYYPRLENCQHMCDHSINLLLAKRSTSIGVQKVVVRFRHHTAVFRDFLGQMSIDFPYKATTECAFIVSVTSFDGV